MQQESIRLEYHSMNLKGFADELYVAKLERISSAPVPIVRSRDNRQAARARLVDILRCREESRNYADFVELKKNREIFGPLDPAEHWAVYVDTFLYANALDSLEPLQLSQPTWHPDLPRSDFQVKYYHGRMNRRPYVVAGVGDILASPAAIWLMNVSTRESALARLYDVFRIGTQGAAYQQLLDCRVKCGQDSVSVRAEWDACQRAVLWEMEYTRNPDQAPEAVLSEWRTCDGAIQRELDWAIVLLSRT